MPKPFSQACENNKQYIFSIITNFFKADDCVLEIGSGTTQHIQFFAEQMPDINWQPSEIESNFTTMMEGLEDKDSNNILDPIILNVQQNTWPINKFEGVFSANCLHIMSFNAVTFFFKGVGEVLQQGGYLCVYGPFKYKSEFTSTSNANFDLWLKDRDTNSGIRDFEKVNDLARQAGLELVEDNAMPANNQLLVWQKK